MRPVGQQLGREARVLVPPRDSIDATVVLIVQHGDRIVTSDSDDMRCLVAAAGQCIAIIAC